MVDKMKLREKIKFMRNQISELKELQTMPERVFISDPIYEAAATRMLQISIEAMLDICSHIISREGWGLPNTYTESVELAVKHGLIDPSMEDTYKAMGRFRNRVVHVYDELDPKKFGAYSRTTSRTLNPSWLQ